MMEEKRCWLCGRNGADDPLDVHHIFGPEAAHRSGETAERLHRYGQEKAMREQGWNREQFRMVFGKNYLDEEPERAAPAPFTFHETELVVDFAG